MELLWGTGDHVQCIHPLAGCIAGRSDVRPPAPTSTPIPNPSLTTTPEHAPAFAPALFPPMHPPLSAPARSMTSASSCRLPLHLYGLLTCHGPELVFAMFVADPNPALGPCILSSTTLLLPLTASIFHILIFFISLIVSLSITFFFSSDLDKKKQIFPRVAGDGELAAHYQLLFFSHLI